MAAVSEVADIIMLLVEWWDWITWWRLLEKIGKLDVEWTSENLHQPGWWQAEAMRANGRPPSLTLRATTPYCFKVASLIYLFCLAVA